MSKSRYELSAAARLELLQIWNYLAEHVSLDVADRMVAEIESGIERVAASPGVGHARADLTGRDVHFYLIKPYLIVYRRDTKPLHIVRILHSSRDIHALLEE